MSGACWKNRTTDRRARNARTGAGAGSRRARARGCSCSTGRRCRTAKPSPARSREAGVGADYIGQDLSDLAGSEAAVRKLAAQHGGIDILINNAALIINKPFEEFSLQEYEEQVRVNSSAAFALARAVAPAMKGKRYGKIVNFCSITLNGRWDGYVPYVASKGAMLGLTKSLARELGPHGICVNAVSPGAVVSEAEKRVFADKLEEYNRLGTREPMPEDADHSPRTSPSSSCSWSRRRRT